MRICVSNELLSEAAASTQRSCFEIDCFKLMLLKVIRDWEFVSRWHGCPVNIWPGIWSFFFFFLAKSRSIGKTASLSKEVSLNIDGGRKNRFKVQRVSIECVLFTRGGENQRGMRNSSYPAKSL